MAACGAQRSLYVVYRGARSGFLPPVWRAWVPASLASQPQLLNDPAPPLDISLHGIWPALFTIAVGLGLAISIALDVVALSMALPLLVFAVLCGYAILLGGLYLLPPLLPLLVAEWRAIRAAMSYAPLLWLMLIGLALVILGYQTSLNYSIDIGSGHDTPLIRDFNPPMFPLPDGSPGNYRYTSQGPPSSYPALAPTEYTASLCA